MADNFGWQLQNACHREAAPCLSLPPGTLCSSFSAHLLRRGPAQTCRSKWVFRQNTHSFSTPLTGAVSSQQPPGTPSLDTVQ